MKFKLLAAVAVSMACASTANAASLISASVTGPSGTVWNTDNTDTFFALFLQRPVGNLINPNDNFTSTPTTEGSNNFAIFGKGFRSGTSDNSDMMYRLTLGFADGAVIGGDYVFGVVSPGGQFRNGTSATAGSTTYTLTGFGWDRSRADNVSAFRAVSGGDPFDYTGQFAYTAFSAAVPEPATWAVFVLGFGALGGAMRSRSRQAAGARKNLRFA